MPITELDVYAKIGNEPKTSRQIASELSVSSFDISFQLRQLYETGKINRQEREKN